MVVLVRGLAYQLKCLSSEPNPMISIYEAIQTGSPVFVFWEAEKMHSTIHFGLGRATGCRAVPGHVYVVNLQQ